MTKRDPLHSLDLARAYVRNNLVPCAMELIRWRDDCAHGLALSEAARLVTEGFPNTTDPMPIVVHLVEAAALEAAQELGAWRTHFPKHAYRTDGSCISLRCAGKIDKAVRAD